MKNWLSRRSYFAKNVPFPLNNVTPCNKLWSHHYPWKNAFLLTSVLFRLVVRPCWWLFRAIPSFSLRRSSVLTFSPRGIQSSMLFSSTGLAFNWVRIQEVSSATLKTSKPGLHLPFRKSRPDVIFSVIATNGEVATGCEPDSSGRQVSNWYRGKIAVLYEEKNTPLLITKQNM